MHFHWFSVSATLLLLGGGDNQPPTCNAGPSVHVVDCNGQLTTLQLDGSGSSDPDGDALSYLWEVTCPFGSLDDPTSPTPILTVDMGGSCQRECGAVRLTVSDGIESSSCQTAAFISDVTAPSIQVPADVFELYTTGYNVQTAPAFAGSATATDHCDPDPVISYTDVVQPGVPPSGIELIVTRTWTATDCMGRTDSDVQTITLVGESYYDDALLDILPGTCPNPLQVDRLGFLAMTAMGSAGLDVRNIDPRSLELRRADGVGESVSPLSSRVRDIAVPSQGSPCPQIGSDGYNDLVLRFDLAQVVDALELDLLPHGTAKVLKLEGLDLDGAPFVTRDRIEIVQPLGY